MTGFPSATAIFLGAVMLDLVFGEPRRAHPVALLGRAMGRTADRLGPPASVAAGGLFLVFWSAIVTGAALLAERWLFTAEHAVVTVAAGSLLLTPTFAIRDLFARVAETGVLLDTATLPEARSHLGRHLVSRDTAGLDASDVAGAAIASLFENLCDSVVAPLFWYAIGGLPAAWCLRTVNTADAMFGYRLGPLRRFGMPAARLDDLLNWIPARLTAILIWIGAGGGSAAQRNGWRTDRSATPSPNGGWPMAAAAWALDIRIDKPALYTLHAAGRQPNTDDIVAALRLARRATALTLLLVAVVTASV